MESILNHQGNKCPITGKSFDETPFYIDHDHKTGLVRGLLSYKPNKGMSLYNDDPAQFCRMAEYLKNPPAVTALGEKVYGVLGRVTKKSTKNRKYGPHGDKTPLPRAAFSKPPKKSVRKEEPAVVISSVSSA